MNNELFYRLALTMVPHIGAIQARLLIEKYGNASTVFHTGKSMLERTEGIGPIRAGYIKNFRDFGRVEKELAFIEKQAITPLFITDAAYPQRLLNCYDPPTLLFYKGNADLNHTKILSVIGTRLNTAYGKYLAEKLIAGLAGENVLIVSGLAFGIDTLAHKAAVKSGLPTVGVLAHGLDTFYPPENKSLAREMQQHGGILTEFISNTKPDKHHFPIRNRIVAGICDAVIVIETGIKGGSMITAELANGYNREVFAFPGKTTDAKSAGCHELIIHHKATLINGPEQIIRSLGWDEKEPGNKTSGRVMQASLFTNLLPEEVTVIEILQSQPVCDIDEISTRTGWYGGTIATILLNLQLKEKIVSLPGNRYKLL